MHQRYDLVLTIMAKQAGTHDNLSCYAPVLSLISVMINP